MPVCLTSNDFSGQNSFLQTNVVVLLEVWVSHQPGTSHYAMLYMNVDEPISLQLPSLPHLESTLLHSWILAKGLQSWLDVSLVTQFPFQQLPNLQLLEGLQHFHRDQSRKGWWPTAPPQAFGDGVSYSQRPCHIGACWREYQRYEGLHGVLHETDQDEQILM